LSSAGNSSINCATARQQMSPYHDDELSPDLRAAMAQHLEGCLECTRSLAELRALSRTAGQMPTPTVPAGIWPQLENKLSADIPRQRALPANLILRRRTWIGLATAAVVVVAASTAVFVWLEHGEHEHGHVAVNFANYLDEFERNPDAAQQTLLAKYEGQAVSYDEAATKVRYQPVTPERLPNGLSRKAVYLLRMPCCTCVQAIYQSTDGEQLAVFEHIDDQPGWFGTRPTIHTRCNGMPTSLTQVDDCLAASWNHQGRFVTVVGARNVEQVGELVAFLSPK